MCLFSEANWRPHHVTNPPVCQTAIRPSTEAKSFLTNWHLESLLPSPSTPKGGGDSLAAKDLLQPTTAFRAPTEAGDTFDSVERSAWNSAQMNSNPKRSSSVASLSPEKPTEHNRDGNKKLVPNQFIHFHTGPLTKTPSNPPELLTPTEVEANTPDGQEGSEKHRPQRKAKPRCIRSNFLSKHHSATSRRNESQLGSTQAGSHLTVSCM